MVTLDSLLVDPKKNKQQKTGAATAPEQPSAPAAATSVEQFTPKYTMTELYEKMNPDKPETAEEKQRRTKKEKRQAIFSAIGDGISALSNLYFTTQYAPNAYNPSQSMSAKARERFDMLRKEREDNNRRYLDGYLRAVQADEANNRDERNWRYKIGRDKIADERYSKELELKEKQQALEQAYKNALITKAQYDSESAKISSQYAAKTAEANIARINSQIESNRTQADYNRKRAENAGSNAGGRSSSKVYNSVFSDANGTNIAIHDNVWKSSMPEIFDKLHKELTNNFIADPKNNERPTYFGSKPSEKDMNTFIKQNWTKSPTIAKKMLELSKLDPATMTSEISKSSSSLLPTDDDEDAKSGSLLP